MQRIGWSESRHPASRPAFATAFVDAAISVISLTGSKQKLTFGLSGAKAVRYAGRFLLTILYILGALASLTPVVFWLRGEHPTSQASAEGKATIIIISLLAAVLLAVAAYQHGYFHRKAQYARVLCTLGQIYRRLQEITGNRNSSVAEIKSACTNVVNQVAGIFSRVTGKPCAACIKVITANKDGRLRVITLCRNDESSRRETTSKRSVHWVDKNTDFEDLFLRTDRCFFENCLPLLRDYKNSSFESYGQPPRLSVPVVEDVIRYWFWPLPYRSTIVCAIFPSAALDDDTEQTVVGYLCVDCKSGWAFSREHDILLLAGVAECLYETVHRYQKKRAEDYRKRIR